MAVFENNQVDLPTDKDELEEDVMSEWVELELPYPPTVNHYWKHTKQGRHYISKAGREFKKIATEVCSQFDPIIGQVEIKIKIYFPDNRARDLDNLPKGIFDSLVGAGLIQDDIVRLSANTALKKWA